MIMRSTEATVIFTQVFNLPSLARQFPAGTYRLVAVDEEIRGSSFVTYRRSSTKLHIPAISKRVGLGRAFLLDCDELETALSADKVHQHLTNTKNNGFK